MFPVQLATVVGCSMGAAVIWAHLELFGDARIAKCVFVDQAPLQVQCIKASGLLTIAADLE